ncbi:hypothetical protein EVG20_g4090 [Dentipellis fragilis]|uniref:Uncharacterized protein n=1 Tax=Dentipellis fragilis TaxID=205917 RepID=A0A4Y9YXM1_9AGAM|nr:hypothetical protein EVG20_g4090 [Dentipellis fragilis]
MSALHPLPSSALPDGIPLAPAPWNTNAEFYIFLARTIPRPTSSDGESFNPNNEPSILQGLPAGSYHSLEEIHPSALQPVPVPGSDGHMQHRGSWPQIVIVRYKDSPVGSYDELMYMAGRFENPVEGTGVESGRITNIYVSSSAGALNGRRNWSTFILTLYALIETRELSSASDTPKHVARFEWIPKPGDPNTTTLRVYHDRDAPLPLSADEPFFVATLTRSRLPAIPVNTARLPFASAIGRALRYVQPPLLRGRYPSDSKGVGAVIKTDDALHGRTSPWLSFLPEYNGWFGVAYIEPVKGEEAFKDLGDGQGFPRCKPIWIGQRFEGMIHLPASEVVGEAGDSDRGK